MVLRATLGMLLRKWRRRQNTCGLFHAPWSCHLQGKLETGNFNDHPPLCFKWSFVRWQLVNVLLCSVKVSGSSHNTCSAGTDLDFLCVHKELCQIGQSLDCCFHWHTFTLRFSYTKEHKCASSEIFLSKNEHKHISKQKILHKKRILLGYKCIYNNGVCLLNQLSSTLNSI